MGPRRRTLRDNPQRLGKPLRAPFAGQWVARRSSYRIRYRIDEVRQVIIVLDIRGRADAYRVWGQETHRTAGGSVIGTLTGSRLDLASYRSVLVAQPEARDGVAW